MHHLHDEILPAIFHRGQIRMIFHGLFLLAAKFPLFYLSLAVEVYISVSRNLIDQSLWHLNYLLFKAFPSQHGSLSLSLSLYIYIYIYIYVYYNIYIYIVVIMIIPMFGSMFNPPTGDSPAFLRWTPRCGGFGHFARECPEGGSGGWKISESPGWYPLVN